MPGPVEGIKVVELGVWVAAPAAGGILADTWGADVVKIEPPAGDPARTFGRMLGLGPEVNPPFDMDNRGKRGIVLDLATGEGRAAATELLTGADVFITETSAGRTAPTRAGFQTRFGEQPRTGLRVDHRLWARRTGRGPTRVRRGGVLGAWRHRQPAHPSR